MRLKKFMLILCLLPLLAMRSQNPGPSIQQKNARLQGTYTFNTYLFVPSTGAASPDQLLLVQQL